MVIRLIFHLGLAGVGKTVNREGLSEGADTWPGALGVRGEDGELSVVTGTYGSST